MNKYITIGLEKLIAMCVIAFGEWNGCQWEYFPHIPKCFSDGLDFQNSCGCYADLLRLTVNEFGRVEIWFADEDGDTGRNDPPGRGRCRKGFQNKVLGKDAVGPEPGLVGRRMQP